MKNLVVLLIVLVGVGVVPFAMAQDALSDTSSRSLEERVKQLEEAAQIEDDKWPDRIEISGVLEFEASYEKKDSAVADEDSSDLSLATVEVGIGANITDHVSGHILFLYEDDEDIVVDEGYILLDGGDEIPLYLKAGEMYVPFGSFESNMISDPLTLEMGETRETALEIGFESNGFYGALYAFNGDVDKAGEDSHVDNYGAKAGYGVETDAFSLDVGVSWINNFGGIIEEFVAEMKSKDVAFALRDYVPGVGFHGILAFGPFTFIGEYVTLLDEPEWNVTDIVSGSMAALGLTPVMKGAEAETYNIEAAYTCELGGRETVFAVGYQGAEDLERETVFAVGYQGAENLEEALPEKRYIGSVGIGLYDGTTLSVEYLHDEYEDDVRKTDMVTAQLVVEF